MTFVSIQKKSLENQGSFNIDFILLPSAYLMTILLVSVVVPSLRE